MNFLLSICVRIHEAIISFVNPRPRYEYKGETVIDNDDVIDNNDVTDNDDDVVIIDNNVDFGPRDEYYPHEYNKNIKEMPLDVEEQVNPVVEEHVNNAVHEQVNNASEVERKTSDSVKMIVNSKKRKRK